MNTRRLMDTQSEISKSNLKPQMGLNTQKVLKTQTGMEAQTKRIDRQA